MNEQKKMDPEVLSMVLDTIDKLERDRLTLDVKLEMDLIERKAGFIHCSIDLERYRRTAGFLIPQHVNR